MTRMQRLIANVFGSWFQLRRRFPPAVLDAMARAVGEGERHHLGEVRFALESRLSAAAVWSGLTPRQRAEQVFAQLGVWDTEFNTGVLIYVLLAEHRIEIVADRGIARCVSQDAWTALATRMRESYSRNLWQQGSLDGIATAHALLVEHFPSEGHANPDELPDQPILL